MYRTIALAACLLLAAETTAQAVSWHVAPPPLGDDDQTGSADAPFATIQHAAYRAQPGDEVLIHAGVYRETVRVLRSGAEGAPITFRGAPGERAVVSGADLVIGPWEKDGDAWVARSVAPLVSGINQAEQVFVDGVMMPLARWPNTPPEALSRPVKATIDRYIGRSKVEDPVRGEVEHVFEDDALPAGDWVGAQIYVQPSADRWSWVHTGVVTAVAGRRVTLRTWSESGAEGLDGAYQVGARYVLSGVRAALNAPGEWLREADRLVLKTPDGESPAANTVEIKRRDFAFVLDEQSHITIKDLEIVAATITTDSGAGDGSRGYGWAQRPSATSHHVVLDHLTARYVSHVADLQGHMMGQWGQNTGLVLSGSDHSLSNSLIVGSAGNGVSALGHRHKIWNNHITDTNYVAVECGCIGTGWGTDSTDQVWWNNTCERTGRSGLQIRTLHNSDPRRLVTRIHHNVIADFMLQDFDGGAFYVYGHDGKFVRIDHNVFRKEPTDGLSFGAYWDFSKNYIFDHNLIDGPNKGIQVTCQFPAPDTCAGGSTNLFVYNNTALGAATWGRAIDGAFDSASVIKNNILSVHVFQDSKGSIVNHWPQYGAATAVRNLVWGQNPTGYSAPNARRGDDLLVDDPGFVDRTRRDYTLTARSPAKDSGERLAKVTFDAIEVPVFDDELVGPPDQGAFEHGVPPWTAGTKGDVGAEAPLARPEAGCGCSTTAQTPTPRDLWVLALLGWRRPRRSGRRERRAS